MIELSWSAPPSDPSRHAVTGYRVEWSADGNTGWTPADPPHSGAGLGYRDSGLAPGTLRHYRVIALSAGGESSASVVASATTVALSVPAAPGNLTATASGGEVIELSWSAPPSDPSRRAVTGYRVEWSADGNTGWTPADPPHSGAGLGYRDSGLAPGTLRHYRVIALSAGGESSASVVASATTSVAGAPPPTWIFAGDVPDREQTLLREEMEYTRAYFAHEFDVTATGFTVLFGDYEALSPVYRNVVGRDLSEEYHPDARTSYAWVADSARGGAVVTLLQGLESDSFEQSKDPIAHEYFHVLQGQLASGFAQLSGGEIEWGIPRSRKWLVEGFASYADYLYTPSRPGRRAFLGDRYTPFKDLSWYLAAGKLRYDDLEERSEDLPEFYFYALSFIAAKFLAEQAEEGDWVEFWRVLGERRTWQQAFEDTFGVTPRNFYDAFEEWLPSQIPSSDQIIIRMLWPDIDVNPPSSRELLYLWPGRVLSESPTPISWSTGSLGLGELTFTVPAGTIGSATVSLWWSDDDITEHLLGWYQDGELTDEEGDATWIKFIGAPYSIEWTLPAHPNTLPRLETRRRR